MSGFRTLFIQVLWIILSLPGLRTIEFESGILLIQPRQEEELGIQEALGAIADSDGAAETLGNVATLLSNLFKRFADVPVKAIQAVFNATKAITGGNKRPSGAAVGTTIAVIQPPLQPIYQQQYQPPRQVYQQQQLLPQYHQQQQLQPQQQVQPQLQQQQQLQPQLQQQQLQPQLQQQQLQPQLQQQQQLQPQLQQQQLQPQLQQQQLQQYEQQNQQLKEQIEQQQIQQHLLMNLLQQYQQQQQIQIQENRPNYQEVTTSRQWPTQPSAPIPQYTTEREVDPEEGGEDEDDLQKLSALTISNNSISVTNQIN